MHIGSFSRRGPVAAALALSLTSSLAAAQARRPRAPAAPAAPVAPAAPAAPTAPSAPAAPSAIPLQEGESLGNRLARARQSFEQLEFDRTLALLAPLRDAPGLAPALGVEAALLEVNVRIAQRDEAPAQAACERAVVLAGYDPDVAREQSPRVQQACRVAAERARAGMVRARGLAVEAVEIATGPVAWAPISVRVRFAGELSGLRAQAEVLVGDEAPVLLTLPPTGSATRTVTLEGERARPGAAVRVTTVISDAYGVVLREPEAHLARVSADEAAVRFGAGSDEGSLEVDGAPVQGGASAGRVLALTPDAHVLRVRTRQGNTAEARVRLTRGEVALVTLRSTNSLRFVDVLRVGATGAGSLLVATGAVFYGLALSRVAQIEQAGALLDPNTNLPVVRYSDIEPLEASRVQSLGFAIGFGATGLALGGLAAGLWIANAQREAPAPRAASREPRGPSRVARSPWVVLPGWGAVAATTSF